jgi:Rrf2 family protein
MLALTRRTEYALIAACHLARAGAVVSAGDIALKHRLRLPLLMNVLKTLHRRGLLASTRGSRGGYGLALAPERITLAALIQHVEGPIRFVQCAPPRPQAGDAGRCDLLDSCPIRQPVLRVHEFLETFLSGVTVADLAFDATYDTRPGAAHLTVLAR